MTINIEMAQCTCWDCGIQYAVPYRWLCSKMEEDDGEVFCPNGHGNLYELQLLSGNPDKLRENAEELQAEVTDLRQQLMQEKHNAEQREGELLAKLDAAGKNADEPEPAPTPIPFRPIRKPTKDR
jgi:hypothetical protein